MKAHSMLVLVAALLSAGVANNSAKAGETYAVLIGIDEYDNYRPARYAARDAQVLAQTLAARGGVPAENILLLHSESKDGARPTRTNIINLTTAHLKRPANGDRLIVCFSGHGFRGNQEENTGRTYLAPVDVDLNRIDETAIELSWLRKVLSECRAETKLLILDACHAGNTRGIIRERANTGLTTGDVEAMFAAVDGIHTLASCQADEVSWSDDARQQGLFTYWINLGLQGAADRDGNGQITGFELFEFVDQPVRLASRNRFGQQQTPGQIVGPKVGRSSVLELRAENWSQSLPRVADLLHEQIIDRRYRKVGVAEFSANLGGPNTLGEIGMFGRFAADTIQGRLNDAANADGELAYNVVPREQVERSLAGLGATALASTKAIERVRTSDNPPAAIIDGTFQLLANPNRLRLQCRLVSVETGDTLGMATGVIGVDADLLAVMGVSYTAEHTLPEPDRATPAEELDEFLTPQPPADLFQWDNNGDAWAMQSNPLLRRDFPYGVKLLARGEGEKYRELTLLTKDGEPNKVFVPARRGDEFLLVLENPTKQDTLVRTYIDGMNTLGARHEPEMGRAAYLLPAGQASRIDSWAKVVCTNGGRTTTVNRSFVFTDPPSSVASRGGYGGQLGQITLVFSEARPMGWVNKLGAGEGVKQTLRTFPEVNVCEGRLLHTVTLHYVDERAVMAPCPSSP